MTKTADSDRHERRVLILAPSRRDAPTLASVLDRNGLVCEICDSLAEFCRMFSEGAGAALIAEEAFVKTATKGDLIALLEKQPAWSEPPVVVITAGGGRTRPGLERRFGRFGSFANVVFLERPLRSATLISTVRSALQARQRQYQLRDHLRERERTEAQLRAHDCELSRLNATLEERVRERTTELENANRRLLEEIRQREQAERALRQAQKMEAIGQLTGGIAHDFNNLLMVFSGGIDMLGRLTDAGRRERIIAGMRQAAQRGEALAKQLLAFSRRMALNPVAIDLRTLLDEMDVLIAGSLREDIRLAINVPRDVWPVMADPTQLELGLLNLAVNARDAMPNGGSLTIRASNVVLHGTGHGELEGDFVRIDVCDTGTGIPSDIAERVFEPFFTTKPVGKGTGLGLSQIYGFAKQSGGHAEVSSKLGEGTSIILHLPRASQAAPIERAEVAPRQQRRPERKGKSGVLLVEDNDQVANMAGQMLEELGYSVRRAEGAAAALAELDNGCSIDFVISDIVMPGGMNGVELARELRRRRPDMPVLLTTGYSEIAPGPDRIEGFPLIVKPYRLETLQAALDQLVG